MKRWRGLHRRKADSEVGPTTAGEVRRLWSQVCSGLRSAADGGAEGGGDGAGEALDVGIVLGFDHDAGELLGAGIAEDNAPVFAERSVGFGEGADDFRNRVKRRLGFDLHVDDGLGVVLEAGNEGIKTALESDERSDFNGGEETVASGRIIEKDYVAGLFAAKDVAALEHFFENVAIADVGASERNVFAGKDAFEAEIGHGGGNDAIAGQFILGFEIARDGEKNAVSVDD